MTIATRTLGRGGPTVGAIGLGCMGMSSAYGTPDDAESVRTLHHAIDRGSNLFDTADAYGPGTNEELIGGVLASRRDEVVIATKFSLAAPPDADGTRRVPRADAAYVPQACEASLRRLGVEVIDVYYLHRPDPLVPIEETVGAMADLVAAGKVRWLGLSEAEPETIRRAVAVHPIHALQSEWSLWTRDLEGEILDTCRQLGVGLVPFSPLGRGMLTGTITSAADFPANDMRAAHQRFQGDSLAANRAALQPVFAMATELGCTPAQLALAWVLGQGDDVIPIPGTKRVGRLDENLGALDVSLTAAQLAELTVAVSPEQIAGSRYPWGARIGTGLTPPASSSGSVQHPTG